ncbi:unnamed protein product [Rotaria sordida]|uniref:protein-serine/threonine phosphatase n=1 Tax=Rotaria sordida TaxID=392033 RepID=A0A814BTX9_9BILA|nr:unnamed protein product [Rotaria sordida]CAF0839683.1 unnamed protein product [Rotaria sordida]CAF0860513.1 unnamed protein product [Rotaria sordida]CAF0928998.1 unnamed protein product [Rotaria sordida]CAF0931329.1 unnamed protein product [Rotaria sordida]
MSSSTLIRVQQLSLFNQNYCSNNNNNNKNGNEKHTISVFRLFLHIFDYIYLFHINIFLYFLLLIKRILIFFFGFWTFIFVSLRGSRKTLIQFQSVKYYDCPLQPISLHRLHFLPKKILVLDLDETLIHSHHDGQMRVDIGKPIGSPDYIIRVEIEKHPVRFFVYKRPHVDYFLETVSKWYELVIFTASIEIYGAAVSDKLDNNRNILLRRFFRQHCTLEFNAYSKDLSVVNNDLSRIFILDNSPFAYRSYPLNAIPIKSWFFDPTDTCLLSLLPFLDALRFCHDVRSVLAMNLHLHKNLMMTNRNSLITQVLPPST